MTPQTNIKKPNNPQQFQLHQNIYKPFSATGEIRAKEQVFFFFIYTRINNLYLTPQLHPGHLLMESITLI